MKIFRDKSILRLLGLALVFGLLLSGGWAWAEEGQDNLQMRNGHEGDPDDGNETVSGGTGGSPNEGRPQFPSLNPTTSHVPMFCFSSFDVVFEINFEFGHPVLQLVSPPQRGKQ